MYRKRAPKANNPACGVKIRFSWLNEAPVEAQAGITRISLDKFPEMY